MENFWSIMSNPLVVSIGGALVGWYLTQFTNKKRMAHEKEINDMKLKADVVVKSRMEWIEKVRELSSDFIILHTELSNTISNHRNIVEATNKNNIIAEEIKKEIENLRGEVLNGSKKQSDIEEKVVKLNTRLDNLNKISEENLEFSNDLHIKFKEEERELYKILFLFKTYFPVFNSKNKVNREHTEIIKIMAKSIRLLTVGSYNEYLKNKETSKETISDFTNKISSYLKEEWEKVKRIE